MRIGYSGARRGISLTIEWRAILCAYFGRNPAAATTSAKVSMSERRI